MKYAMMLISCITLSIYAAVGWGFSHQLEPLGSIHVNNGKETDLVDMSRISMESAVKTAMWSIPGKVFDAELENSNGYLVYRVKILRDDHRVVDVKVDAGNSKVLKIDGDQRVDKEEKGSKTLKQAAKT
jgi:hypothetical protein